MKYYVYGLVDPRDQKVKYIGKGCGNRMFEHLKWAKRGKALCSNYTKLNALQEILDIGYEDIAYCKLYETDDEFDAYNQEAEFISQYQTLAPKGWNLCTRGVATKGMTGKKHSEQTKQCMSESRKGENNPMYGKPLSSEHKEKLKKPRSEETKHKISLSTKGRQAWNRGLKRITTDE